MTGRGRFLIILITALFLMGIVSGCGKKGDPRPPGGNIKKNHFSLSVLTPN